MAGFIWSTIRAKLRMAISRRRPTVVGTGGGAFSAGRTNANPEITTPTAMAAMAAHITGVMPIMDMSKCMGAASMNIHRCSATPAQVRATPAQNNVGRGTREAGGTVIDNSSFESWGWI